MIYEILLTLVIILLGFLVYRQYVKRAKINLFQEAVHMRFSACYSEEGIQRDSGRSIVKLRIELIELASRYKGICVEEIGFIQYKNIQLREFNRFFFTARSTSHNIRELIILVDVDRLPEIRLNGLEIYINGHLLCLENQKYAVHQVFVVFERPAVIGTDEKKSLA